MPLPPPGATVPVGVSCAAGDDAAAAFLSARVFLTGIGLAAAPGAGVIAGVIAGAGVIAAPGVAAATGEAMGVAIAFFVRCRFTGGTVGEAAAAGVAAGAAAGAGAWAGAREAVANRATAARENKWVRMTGSCGVNRLGCQSLSGHVATSPPTFRDVVVDAPPGPAVISPTMKTVLLSVVFALFSINAVFAKEFKLPDARPVVTITLPDTWKPEYIDKGAQGQTADNAVYLSVETSSDEEQMGAIIDDTFAMLKEHNAEINRTMKRENKFLINGLPADELLYDGKDQDGPTTVSITFVTVGKTALVLTYWASTEGTKNHHREVEKILASIKPLQKPAAGNAAAR